MRNLPPTKPVTREVTTPASFGKTDATIAYNTIPPIAPRTFPHTGHPGGRGSGIGGNGQGTLHLLGYGVPHHPAIKASKAKDKVISHLR